MWLARVMSFDPNWISAIAAVAAAGFAWQANRAGRENTRRAEQREADAIESSRLREDAAQIASDKREQEAEQRQEERDRARREALAREAKFQPLERALAYARAALDAYQEEVGFPTGLTARGEEAPFPKAVRIWLEKAPRFADEAKDPDVSTAIEKLRSTIVRIVLPPEASNASLRAAVTAIRERGNEAVAEADELLRKDEERD